MRENVSVSEAINKGQLYINLPVIMIIIATIGATIYLDSIYSLEKWIYIVSLILGVALGWLYWSFAITKWRIWAFENVRNVHELKEKAIEGKLIWDDESIFEKTEIRSYEDKQKLHYLERKFEKEDVYYDDISVSKETLVYISKFSAFFQIFLSIILLSPVYILITEDNYVFVAILFLIGVYLGYEGFKKIKQINSIQIKISAQGITNKNEQLVPWNNIQNERVYCKNSGKHKTCHLAYYIVDVDEFVEINLDELDINYSVMENILRVYRVRFEKNNTF